MNQKLKMGKKKGKKANDSVTEEKAVENAEPTNIVEPSPAENGVKVKKSKKNKKSLNESNSEEPKEILVHSSENGNKSKKSKKNKNVDEDEESQDSSLMEVQTPENAPKVNVIKQNLKQSLIAENTYISSLMGIINFPKRADDSDDDGKSFLS